MGYFTNYVNAATLPAHEEMVDPDPSPQETITGDGFEATRSFQCAWADRINFVDRMLGYANGKTLNLPCRYPMNERAIAVSAAVKGAGQAVAVGGVLVWDKARISINYRVPEYETRVGQDREPFVLETLEGAAEFITIPAKGLYWDKDKAEELTDSEAPGMLRKLWTWNYTMLRLPELPAQVSDLIGKLNEKRCYSFAFKKTFEPGTLLMGTPTIKQGLTVAGEPSWEVTLSATWNEFGWNKLIKKGGKIPQPIYADYEVKVGTETRIVTGEYSIYGKLVRFQPLIKETATA